MNDEKTHLVQEFAAAITGVAAKHGMRLTRVDVNVGLHDDFCGIDVSARFGPMALPKDGPAPDPPRTWRDKPPLL